MKDISCDVAGLQKLTHYHSWKNVLVMSSKLFSESESMISCYPIWRFRLESLFRLKMYDELSTEAASLLNIEEKKDTVNVNIVYSMKLLLSEIKVMTGRNQEALDQLYILRNTLQKQQHMNTPATANTHFSVPFWLLQIGSHIVNAAVRLRNWKTAVTELRRMLCDVKAATAAAVDAQEVLSMKRSQVMVLLRLSRVLLQVS